MPNEDGTGPNGRGAKTGRGLGSCDKSGKGRGCGRGQGRGQGRGTGRNTGRGNGRGR